MKDKDGIDLTEPTPNLFKKVVDWGKDKGIVLGEGANPTKQLAKTMEELGEVASALLRDNQEGVEDGIGDVMVCLIILAAQNGTDAFKCLQGAYDEIRGRKGKTVDGVFVKESDLPTPSDCEICGRKSKAVSEKELFANNRKFCNDCGRCVDGNFVLHGPTTKHSPTTSSHVEFVDLSKLKRP